jgi:hypothetical protein
LANSVNIERGNVEGGNEVGEVLAPKIKINDPQLFEIGNKI